MKARKIVTRVPEKSQDLERIMSAVDALFMAAADGDGVAVEMLRYLTDKVEKAIAAIKTEGCQKRSIPKGKAPQRPKNCKPSSILAAHRNIADEFGSLLDLFNMIIFGLRILLDAALADSQSAKHFLAELAGSRVDEDMCDLYEQVYHKADSLYEAAIKNSTEAKCDLHSMAEQLFQGFDFRSAEYPGYVADNWE